MQSVAPQREGFAPKFEFKKVDTTLIADVNRFANDYTNSLDGKGLNVLCMQSLHRITSLTDLQ